MTLVALLCAAQAQAQTPAPPSPSPPPPPPSAPDASAPQDPYGADPVLGEQIAEQLVARAQELLDARIWVDAKQLAVEAVMRSPKGNAADRARYIIKVVNAQLGIKDDPAPSPPSEVTPEPAPDLTPFSNPTGFDPSRDPPPQLEGRRDGRTAGMVHGALLGGVLGATVGAYVGGDNPASVAVPLGIATGIGSGLVARRVVKQLDWDEAQVRTAGSFSLWGGAVGGLFAGAVTGADEGPPSGKGVMLGASIGSTVGLVAGGALARNRKLTRGDVALVDTLAGIGTAGGLTMGMLMQPAKPEAYAVNAIIGASGGVLIGMIAAPNANTTPRRMLRVAGLAAAGGALPFLLYAGIYDESSDGDEQVVGLLSTAGLIGGAYLGFRLTQGMDAGLDVHGREVEDAPAAALGRNSDGSWTIGRIGFQRTPRALSNTAGALTLTILGATF